VKKAVSKAETPTARTKDASKAEKLGEPTVVTVAEMMAEQLADKQVVMKVVSKVEKLDEPTVETMAEPMVDI
jgi:hypothetical protein